MLTIRPLQRKELPRLKDFAPPEWNTDLSRTFAFQFGRPYFHPLAAELDGALVGCAQGLLNGRTGWLGNIIVLPEYRSRGIGAALTRRLVEFFASRSCSSQVLIATPMGEPVYRKLGFETVAYYLLMKSEEPPRPVDVPAVGRLERGETDALLALDQAVTGEQRGPFLKRFLADGWVHRPPGGTPDGFFLSTLGQGPVLAGNDRAGLALLAFKTAQGCREVVLPEANQAGVNFLEGRGFREVRRLPRMALGADAPWQPEKVFSRGAGYCG